MRKKDEDKREAIVLATLDLVKEKGVAGIKMAELAKMVGISPSTLYVYFQNKEDLISKIFIELLRRSIQHLVSGYNPDLPYKLNVKNLWEKSLRYRVEHYWEIHFMEQVKKSPFFAAELSEMKAKEMEIPSEILMEGKRNLLVKDIPNPLLYAAWEGINVMLSDMIIQGSIELNEEVLNDSFDMVWDSMAR